MLVITRRYNHTVSTLYFNPIALSTPYSNKKFVIPPFREADNFFAAFRIRKFYFENVGKKRL